MKIIGGILVTLGALFLLQASVTYIVLGKIHEPDAFGGFMAVIAVGIIVVAIGVKLFRGKPTADAE